MATVTLTNINKVYDGNVHAVVDFNLKIKDYTNFTIIISLRNK